MTKRELAMLLFEAVRNKVDDVSASHDDTMSQLDIECDGRALTVLIMDELDDQDDEQCDEFAAGLPLEDRTTFDDLLDSGD